MMDNYDQTGINTNRLEQLDDVHPIKLQERNEFFHAVEEFAVNKQNFNFGANILNTKTMSTSSSSSMASTTNNSCGENVVKTNEKIKTFTLPPTPHTNLEESLNAEATVEVADEDPLKKDVDKEEFIGNSFTKYYAENESSQQTQNFTQLRNSPKEHPEDEDILADDSDDTTSDSDYSDLSGLSDMSGRDWKPINQRPFNWVQKQIHSGANPREIFSKFLPSAAQRISPELTDMTLWRILASVLSEPPRRKKLSYVNTFEDVIDLLHKSQNIIVLTGAGVSVSCGIPDFRSSDGIYSRLAKDFPDLPGPQAMFDINYFSRDPRPFYKFAREIYPGQFKPSPCHRFIKMLEQKQKLLRNYTQNIDTLEQVAGIKNVIECHGSFSTASCTKCKYKCDANSIRKDIFAQRIPACPNCQPNVEQSLDASQSVSENDLRQLVENGIMKPDIVFFGEGLPDEFHTVMASDKDKCDLLIVMGSSLKVRPVALIPSSIPNQVPQILINREQLHHLEFDVELLGDGDVIINQICHRLGEDWKDICFDPEVLKESKELIPLEVDIDDKYIPKAASTNTDTLSMNSNRSPELLLQSADSITNSYCYSGFASSSTCAKKDVEFLSPDDLDEPMSTNSLCGPCDYRHLSIDSSKDSGILTDSSNSAPSFSNFMDSNDTNKIHSMPVSTMQAIPSNPAVSKLSNTKTADKNCSEAEKQSIGRQMKYQSAAERLYKGTYYVHDNSASYVFPGAQVSWCSDSEEDDHEHLEEYEEHHCNDDETNQAPLSPLMTPSVENEMVQAIASNSNAAQHLPSPSINFTNAVSLNTCLTQHKPVAHASHQQAQKKRPSNDTSEEKLSDSTSKSFATEATICSANDAPIHNYPPLKKPRSSSDHMTTSTNSSVESL